MEPNTPKSSSDSRNITLGWSRDIQTIDSLLNHEDVVGWLGRFGHNGRLSLEKTLEFEQNGVLLIEFSGTPVGFFLFVGEEVHIVTLPTFRGPKALQAARNMPSFVFLTTTLNRITAKTYDRRVGVFSAMSGFGKTGEEDTLYGRCSVFELTRDDWLKKMTTP